MSFRLSFKWMLLLFLGLSTFTAFAQQPASASIVRGLVADPDGAVIPGATVTLTPASGKALTVQSGSDGTYSFRSVTPGTYSVTITMNEFATFVRQGVRLGAGQTLTIDAKMAVQSQDQVVQVTAQSNALSVDQDSNASATVISGKDLDALSDDPDELSSELTALAGPSTGPNGGQIYIDGFTGGQLPPKSSIREIRINQNPFSAQYDRVGFGRIEVFTKPGTDKFHGSAQLNGNDSSFNTSNPLVTTPIQPYHTIFFLGNVTGPLNKNASFTTAGSYRAIQDNAIVNGTIVSPFVGSTTVCAPGIASPACVSNPFQATTLTPQTRWDITPRIDLAIGKKNTLTTRFQYTSNSQTNNGVGSFVLASAGSDQLATETTLQMNDTQIVSNRIINETRFEFQHELTQVTAITPGVANVSVQGNFTTGGSANGNSKTTQDHIEVQNYTSIQLKKNFIRMGGRLRLTSQDTTTNAGANGVFTYSSIANYQAGNPSQFSITNYINSTTSTTTADWGIYAEDDWKVRPNLTVSYGIRYEGQNFISEAHDFAPRVSFAYGLGSKKGNPKTVLRGGFGVFYDRFMLTNQMNTVQQNGINEINSTAIFTGAPAQTCSPLSPQGCAAAASTHGNQIYQAAPNLRAPYTMLSAIGADQQLFRGATISVNYLHAIGDHQFLSRVASQSPLTYQYVSEGEFRQNQIIANFNFRGSRYYSVSGYYTLNFANSDTAGVGSFPSNSNNIKADYGRSTFSVRNRAFISGVINAPFKISLSPFMLLASGTPYNITTGTDVNGDSEFTDRPSFQPGRSSANCKVAGDFYTPPNGTTSYTPIPVNYCTGPDQFVMNLRVSRTFGFGPLTDAARARANNANGQGGPGGSSAGFGSIGGGGRGGAPRGGPGGGGGGRGGAANTGHRYNLSLGAQVQNLFNYKALQQPNGTLTSRQFGVSTQLAGMPYTSNSAVERLQIFLNMNF